MSPTQEQLVDIHAAPIAVKTYSYYVTLRNHKTEEEYQLEISTLTDSFAPVLREIYCQRAMLGLFGYEIFEVVDLSDPFLPDEF